MVLEHMFHPSEMEEEATLREDLQDDIKTECLKMGPVEKVRSTQIKLLPAATASKAVPACQHTQQTHWQEQCSILL